MKHYIKGAMKTRAGNYRIIFEINENKHEIEILDIMPRKKDYKN